MDQKKLANMLHRLASEIKNGVSLVTPSEIQQAKIARNLRKWAAAVQSEGPDLSKVVKKIADLTDQNYHSEAVLELAKAVGDQDLIRAAKKLVADYKKAGHMTDSISKVQNELRVQGFNAAQKKWGPTARKQLISAF